jgi:nickel-dependent lactate racemase
VPIPFLCGRETIHLDVPDGAAVFESGFPEPAGSPSELVLDAVRRPIGKRALRETLGGRRDGEVVVVVSDVTRPIPYAAFLPGLLAEIEAAGVDRDEITILIATGLHRPSTPAERSEMFGNAVVADYRIVDHRADDDASLVERDARTWSGAAVRVNRRFVEAGFRLTTGLVEPHFMAGFSGGRKAVCPGLASLETVRNFHGAEFLANPAARNGNLDGNPLHEESLSVARSVGVDFALDVVLDRRRRVVRAFAGDIEAEHAAASAFAARCACRPVAEPADVAVTSCGGYPLDATFYQCVKGIVSCLPAVRPGGEIIAFGGCSEGIGSGDYAQLMRDYAGRWRAFLDDIRRPDFFVRDQWQFQMHCRALERVGRDGLHFVTNGLGANAVGELCVTGHSGSDVAGAVQERIAGARSAGKTVAVFPEGPYCVPL